MRLELVAWALVGALAVTPVSAQNIHIQSSKGTVSVLRGDVDPPVVRQLDAPLVTDDRIVTGPKSQAGISVDPANSIQVGADSVVKLADAYPGRSQFILTKGSMTWNVLGVSPSEAEVVSPSIAVHPRQPGVYTIAVNEQGETEITAKEGDLEVWAPTGSQWLNAGQKMLVRGPASDPEFQLVGTVSRWKRLVTFLAKLQIAADVATSFASDAGAPAKPHAAAVQKPSSANTPVRSPEAGHPPSTAEHPAQASSGSRSTPARPAQASSGSRSTPAPAAQASSGSRSAPAPPAPPAAPSRVK
jgi:hypothetical protein